MPKGSHKKGELTTAKKKKVVRLPDAARPNGVTPREALVRKILREGVPAEDSAFVEQLLPVIGDMVYLVRMATDGDPSKVSDLIQNPRSFWPGLVRGNHGALLGYMLTRSMREYMTRESNADPLDHGKFMLKLLEYAEKVKDGPKQADEVGRSRNNTSDRGSSRTSDQLLQGMETPGEENTG